jgi:queuine tRNA-ribosyltransferase
LVKSEELLGIRLVTLHNLHFYLNLMTQVRAHIEQGTFAQFRKTFVGNYRKAGEIDVPEVV